MPSVCFCAEFSVKLAYHVTLARSAASDLQTVMGLPHPPHNWSRPSLTCESKPVPNVSFIDILCLPGRAKTTVKLISTYFFSNLGVSLPTLRRSWPYLACESGPTVCPLCQEDEETVLYLLGECSALVVKRTNILGSPYLCYEELGKMHWCAVLRLAKASQRF